MLLLILTFSDLIDPSLWFRNRLELHSFKLRFENLALTGDKFSIPLIALVCLSINEENCEMLCRN